MTEWSKRQRLEAVLQGELPDRLPVALWRHWPGDDQEAAPLAAAHLKWQKDYDWDMIKVSPASSYCLVDWGVEDRWEGTTEGTRTYTKRVIESPDDWTKLEPLDPRKGMLAKQIKALKLIGDKIGPGTESETPFIATIFSPLSQAKNLAGQERMLDHMREAPERFGRGLQTITDTTIAYIEEAKAAGIAGIFYAIQHARFSVMNIGEYQAFGRPYDEQILDVSSDLWLNMVHLHGEKGIMFDLVADYPVQLMNWHDRDTGFTLSQGLEQFSGAVSGGVSRWALYQDNPEQTLLEARDAVEQTGGRRLMLGVGCVIMTNTPLRNLEALRQSVALEKSS